MPSYLKNDTVLVRYPFSDLSGSKVRPAVVVSDPHPSQDVIIIPLTSTLSQVHQGRVSDLGPDFSIALYDPRAGFSSATNLFLRSVLGVLRGEISLTTKDTKGTKET